MKKNGFLTFCCALVPGCGQMYQGYMKRGASLLVWFCGVIALAVLTHIYLLCLILPIIWAYSFFDTFNIRALSPEQRAAFADGFVPGGAWQKEGGPGQWLNDVKVAKIIGWAMVGLGVLIIVGNVWDTVLYYLWRSVPFIADILERVPGLILAVAIIWLGLRLLRGGRLAGNSAGDTGASAQSGAAAYGPAGQEDDEPMFTAAPAPAPEAPVRPYDANQPPQLTLDGLGDAAAPGGDTTDEGGTDHE